jgi:acetyl-CoA acyltransferase
MGFPVIIEAVRTPFGRRAGAFRDLRPDAMLAHAFRALLVRSGVAPDRIEDIVVGCVSQAGEQSANVARQAGLLARLPVEAGAFTLNRMCGSGQTAVHIAAQAVAAGDAQYVIGGGVESMSRVPMFLDVTLGREPFSDWGGLNPELLAAHELPHQGASAELLARAHGITRADLDAFAQESHRRAHDAAERKLNREIVAVDTKSADGSVVRVERDEGIRSSIDPARMAGLAPIFEPNGGVITAGNSSQMSDGAAAVLVGDSDAAKADGLRARARFLARVSVGSDPRMQLDGVIPATRKALAKSGLSLADLDWIEINEAFACVPLAWSRAFDTDPATINRWGGAIAHGHPLGATGAGLIAKTLSGLEATGGTVGMTVFCVGHGMSTVTVVERL